MKTTKRFLSFLLTLAMMFSVIAVAVVPTAAAGESTSTVVVSVPLSQKMVTFDGTYTVVPHNNGDIDVKINSVKATGDWIGNGDNGIIFFYRGNDEPVSCTLVLDIEISGDIGASADIVFNYRYNETYDGVDLYADKAVKVDVVNYSDLIKQIERAEKLDPADYVSLKPIETPLKNAKASLNASYLQTEVTKLTAALKNAIDGLKKSIDYERLDSAIAKAESLNKYAYEPDGWANLEAELAKAKAVRANASANQFTVTSTAIDLENAMVALISASTDNLDTSALQAAYEAAAALKETDYQPEGWVAFAAALADAESVLNGGALSQLHINDVTDTLVDVTAALVPVTPDNTELRVLIAQAEGLDVLKYEQNDAWTHFQSVLDEAKVAVNAELQSAVDAAYEALETAMSALTALGVDTAILDAAIAQAADYTDASKYTNDSWNAFQTALAEANAAKVYTEQHAINAAAYKLSLAIASLVEVVDYTELNAAITMAEGRTPADYTDATWATVQTALDAAKALTASNDQDAVDDATVALWKALAGLEKKTVAVQIDYAKLNAAITSAEALTQTDYTEETWNAVASALNAAKAAKTSNDQREVDAAAAALEVAIAALRAPASTPSVEVDYTALNAAIAAAEAKTEADYTAESWAAVKTALDAAKALTASDDQAAVTAAATALYDAIAALEKPVVTPPVEMDYSVLNGAIAAAEALTEADYTAETWSAVTSALNAAKALTASDDQAAVTAAAKTLYAAIAALRTPVVTVPGEPETVIVEPTDPFCNTGSHTVWPVLFGIFLALTVALAALIVVYLILKKKKENDDTPVVDYDIEEDEASETEEAAAEEAETEADAEEEAETEGSEAEVFAEDEAENTAE